LAETWKIAIYVKLRNKNVLFISTNTATHVQSVIWTLKNR
jgi:hypothetical protein